MSDLQAPRVSEWQRLHPSAVAVWAVERLRAALFGLIAAGASRRFWVIGLVSVGILVLGVGMAVLRQRRFRFRIEGDALVIRDGVIQVRHTVIPLERIQSVDIVEKLRHRIFGVVELRAEAVGGQQAEASLVALSKDEAEGLRRRLLRLQQVDVDRVEPIPVLAKLGPRDLVLAGITGGRVAVFAVLLGYLDDLLPGDVFELLFRRAFERAESGGSLVLYLLLPLVIIVGISVALSLAATAFRYWDFTVTREHERLVITRGLFDKRRSAIPLKRLQAVRVVENPIRRLLKLASLTVVVAGYSGPREEIEETSMLLPIASRDRAVAIAAELTGVPEIAARRFDRFPARSLVPRFIASLVGPSVLFGPVALVEASIPGSRSSIALYGLIIGLALAFLSVAGWRAKGLALSIPPQFILFRSGAIFRRTIFIPLANVQNLSVRSGPVSRVLSLATLTFGVPKVPTTTSGLDRTVAFNSFEALATGLSAK